MEAQAPRPAPMVRAPAPPAAVFVASLAAAGGVLAVHALRYREFLSDDALISLRYARRLLDGHGLTWTAGEAVEGYSNLLWVLACAALGATGLDLVSAARLLATLCAGATLACIGLAVRRAGGSEGAAAWAMLAAALAAPLAAWIPGGLEQTMVAALLAGALAALARTAAGQGRLVSGAAAAGLLYGLLALTRPDGLLFALSAAAALLTSPLSRRLRTAAVVCLPALAAVTGQTAFRLAYYGEWLPNPAHMKVAMSARRLIEGGSYVGTGLLWMAGLALPGLLAAAAAIRPAKAAVPVIPAARVAAFQLAIWMAWVTLIGGDIFPARRHLVPVVVLLSILAGLWVAMRAGRPGHVRHALAALLLALLAAGQLADPESRRARHERWVWQGRAVGRLLGQAFVAEEPLLAVDPAGCVPYWSGLPALDMLGLSDRHIARTPPRSGRAGWIGHDRGDGAYVLGRQPDLVLFCEPAGSARPCFTSGIEMAASASFREHYRLLTFRADGPPPVQSRIWARLDSPRIGILRTANGIEIPGFLLADRPGVVASLDAAGRLVAESAAGRLTVAGLSAPPGEWRLEAEGEGSLRMRVRGEPYLAPVQGGAALTLAVPPGPARSLRVEIEAERAPLRLRSFRLQPEPGSPGAAKGRD